VSLRTADASGNVSLFPTLFAAAASGKGFSIRSWVTPRLALRSTLSPKRWLSQNSSIFDFSTALIFDYSL
jgi:hypothetical protein